MVAITKVYLVVSLAILPGLAAPIRVEETLTKTSHQHTPLNAPDLPTLRSLPVNRRLEVRSSSGSGTKNFKTITSRTNSRDLKSVTTKAPDGAKFVLNTPMKDTNAGPSLVFFTDDDAKVAEKRKRAQSLAQSGEGGQALSSSPEIIPEWEVYTPKDVQKGGEIGKKERVPSVKRGKPQEFGNVPMDFGDCIESGREQTSKGSKMDLKNILNQKGR